MKKLVIYLHAIAAFFVMQACENDTLTNETTPKSLEGYVQKGPFLLGSSVSVFDLDTRYNPTGMVFNTQIENNEGKFVLNEIPLSSDYVLLKADGYYYNEVQGEKSKSQITLYALSDISKNSEIYINLLTHLEKPRVEKLLENGLSFYEAKQKAQKEVLQIFNISNNSDINSERMSIHKKGDHNAQLLALTSVLQGYRSEGELSELLAYIAGDIRPDGILDDQNLGSALINDAVYLDTISIARNLEERYKELDAPILVPWFGKYINQFISNTTFQITESLIKYPETGIYGKNILNSTDTVYGYGQNNTYSLHAVLPEGASLKVVITSLKDSQFTGSDTTSHIHPGFNRGIWYYAVSSEHNWSITLFSNYKQTFTAIEDNQSCDLKIHFDKGTFRVDFYEMGFETPNKRKFFKTQ